MLIAGKSSALIDMKYDYDDLYRLTSAHGDFNSSPGKLRHYDLAMSYDDIHNIVNKNQLDTLTSAGGKPITQKGASYKWDYAYTGTHPGSVALTFTRRV